MTAHECLDCHHEWADDDPDDPVDEDWGRIDLADIAAEHGVPLMSTPTRVTATLTTTTAADVLAPEPLLERRSVPREIRACPHCGTTRQSAWHLRDAGNLPTADAVEAAPTLFAETFSADVLDLDFPEPAPELDEAGAEIDG